MTGIPHNIDIHLGYPTLPERVRRVRSDHRGALSIYVDTEDHDRDLLRSLAAAVRDNPDAVTHLKTLADLSDLLDRAELDGDHAEARIIAEEMAEEIGAIEAHLPGPTLGEGLIASLSTHASSRLLGALTERAVA